MNDESSGARAGEHEPPAANRQSPETAGKLSSRPEAPWALWTGLAGGLAAAAISVVGILKSGSSTAAIGFIFVPFVAAIAAIPAGIWGLALGHVWLHLRGVQHSSHPALLAAAWVFALAVPAVAGWEAWRRL